MANFFSHDPNAVLDYQVDWSDWLGTDTISSVDWVVPAGLTETTRSNTTTTATIWLSGGVAGQQYAVVNRVVTLGGRTEDRTIFLNVTNAAFTYDLSTPVGQIRLEIGDTNNAADQGVKPDGTNFSDAELTYMYTQEANKVLAAAARACEVLARMWGRAGETVRIRDYSINTASKAGQWAALAKELRERSGTLYKSGSAPTTRVDGYSNDVNSRENDAAGTSSENWRERKVLKWP